jgi:hypothetical protein
MLKRLSDFESARVRNLILGMATPEPSRGYDLNPAWVQNRGWCIVPVEDSGHLADEEIERIVPALRAAGFVSCFAIGAPDLPADFANVHELFVSEEDFKAFNREFGVLRVLLTSADLSWAISCNEWFNLFGGPENLIEKMLGVPIDRARRDFLEYAGAVEQGYRRANANRSPVQLARRC